MKIALVSNDLNLQKKLGETGCFDDIALQSKVSDVKNTDILVASDNSISCNDFIQFVRENEAAKPAVFGKAYYMLSNMYESNLENIYLALKVNNIGVIPPRQTVSQIAEKLVQSLVPGFNKQKNIVTLFGTDSKVGTTLVAQGVAEVLSRNENIKVCLLFLNGSPSTSYIKNKEAGGLDSIKVKIMNNIMTVNDLVDSCIVRGNLYILPGNETIVDTRRYAPENIEYLIDMAAKEFGAVIIDAGTNLDNGLSMMSVTALNSTNHKYLVTTQQRTAKEKFDRVNTQLLKLLGIDSREFMLVVNKYVESASMLTGAQMGNMYNMPVAGILPYMDMLGWQAEEESKSLVAYDNREYNKSMEGLCKYVAAQLEIELSIKSTEKTGLVGLLKGRNRNG